jgi:hypothetical protein
MTTATAPEPKTESGKTESGQTDEQECSTRDILAKLKEQVTEAKLQQQITTQKVTALEEHLKQLQEFDGKITKAAEAYGKGIDAVCAGFDDLRKSLEQSKSSFECLVQDDVKKKVGQVLDDLRHRREILEKCEWQLKQTVIDRQCELEHANAEVVKAEEHLNHLLALLDERTKELAALKELKEAVGCSDTTSNECRYAFYLDLERRVEVECLSVHRYTCELVDQVKALDGARQKAQEIDGLVRTAKDQLERVTSMYDDLVEHWQDQLCRAVTAGSVEALPPALAGACGETQTPTQTTPETSGKAPTEQQGPEQQSGEPHEGGGEPAQEKAPETSS